jgi:serine/threonine-protein kinase
MSDTPVDDRFISGLTDLKAVGRYKILRKLGQGGTAVVYLGKDPYINRLVAVKLSRPSDRYREGFFLEAQSSGRLNHPNIVAVYDAGVYREFCYITMEHVQGESLERYCNIETLLSISKVVEIIFSVCNALEYAHQKGVIHRDIKPSNIMLDQNGSPKITDFGIAQVTGQTAPLGIFGTPSYMSPEQLQDELVGPRGDIFSIGCVLYELLTGQQAFAAANNFSIMYKITHEEPPSMLSLRPDLPPILENITRKAIAKDLDSRYQACKDLAYDLRVALRGLSGPPNGDAEKLRDLVDYVHRVPFFHHFDKEQLRELISAATIRKFPKDKMIVEHGEIDDSFYIILSGKARVRKDQTDIALLGAGECFGEMAFISGQARSASVVTATACALLKISATLLDRSSKSIQLQFYRSFATTLVRRLVKAP